MPVVVNNERSIPAVKQEATGLITMFRNLFVSWGYESWYISEEIMFITIVSIQNTHENV
jgi:hypothetical protein